MAEQQDTEEDKSFLAVLLSEDDLGAIVRTHLFIDSRLNQLIEEGLVAPKQIKLDGLRFPLKVSLAIAMGFVPEPYRHAMMWLNSQRNKFAHNVTAQLTEDDADNFFKSFPAESRQFLGIFDETAPKTKLRSCLSFLYGRLTGLLREARQRKSAEPKE